MDILWSIVLSSAGLGLGIYFTRKVTDLDPKDFLFATLGGLGFAVSWLMISLLLDAQPNIILATFGGVAVFFSFLAIRALTNAGESG